MSTKISWSEDLWVQTLSDEVENIPQQFAGLVTHIAKGLKKPKTCLKTISAIFENTKKSVLQSHHSEIQKLSADTAVDMIEGLCFAIEGYGLKEGNNKLMPQGTKLKSAIFTVGYELQQGHMEKAKEIFGMLAYNILKKGDCIEPFEDLELSSKEIGQKARNWATALCMLSREFLKV